MKIRRLTLSPSELAQPILNEDIVELRLSFDLGYLDKGTHHFDFFNALVSPHRYTVGIRSVVVIFNKFIPEVHIEKLE